MTLNSVHDLFTDEIVDKRWKNVHFCLIYLCRPAIAVSWKSIFFSYKKRKNEKFVQNCDLPFCNLMLRFSFRLNFVCASTSTAYAAMSHTHTHTRIVSPSILPIYILLLFLFSVFFVLINYYSSPSRRQQSMTMHYRRRFTRSDGDGFRLCTLYSLRNITDFTLIWQFMQNKNKTKTCPNQHYLYDSSAHCWLVNYMYIFVLRFAWIEKKRFPFFFFFFRKFRRWWIFNWTINWCVVRMTLKLIYLFDVNALNFIFNRTVCEQRGRLHYRRLFEWNI